MAPRTPPQDPMVRALISAARRSALSRRSLLTAATLGGAGAALSACAPPLPPAADAKAIKLPKDVSETDKVVRWANWTAYLDMDDDGKTYPTLDAFTKKTGIKAEYSEDIEDNDSYFNKIRPQLIAGQDINRDIFTFTDWMANRVIREQLCQPLELIRMPNASNLLEPLKEVSFDPGRNYSLTWQSGFAGIGYHKGKVGRELKSLDDLWAPDLKGKVTVFSEFRDTLGCILLQQGVDISKPISKDVFEKGVAEVQKRMSDGNIRRIKGNSYLEDLKTGNAVAGIVWSGDIFVLRAETEDDDWEFVIPESGGTLWSDNMMVPITSTHRRNAETLMNYYYEPEVAAQVAAWVNYVSPVNGAKEILAKTDPELAESPFIFPSESYIAEHNIKGFVALSAEQDSEYSAIWQKVMGN